MKRLAILTASVFLFLVVPTVSFAAPCSDCPQLVQGIRQSLFKLHDKLNDIEHPNGKKLELYSNWDSLTARSSESDLFYARLEAKQEYEHAKERLTKIEADLSEIEKQVTEREAALNENSPITERDHVRWMRALARNQRLVVNELLSQLKSIHSKFKQLDAQIAAHETRINNVEEGSKKLSADLEHLIQLSETRAVASEKGSFPDTNLAALKIGSFPRTELHYQKASDKTVQVTVDASGSFFGLVEAHKTYGAVFGVNYSTEVFVVSPGIEPILSRDGVVKRDTSTFCATTQSFSLRGYSSTGGSVGFKVYFVNVETGITYTTGTTFAIRGKRYSELLELRQGRTFKEAIRTCEKFTEQVARHANLNQELLSMVSLKQKPESTCYKDYDCKSELIDPKLKETVVNQCVQQADRQKPTCEHRLVSEQGKCKVKGETSFWGRTECASGFRCNTLSRKCTRINDGRWALEKAFLKEAKVIDTSAHYSQVSSDSNFCETVGKLDPKQGWRLPSSEELPNVAHWYRSKRQLAESKQGHRRATDWYYTDDAFKGLMWADGPWAYILANDSATQYKPEDPTWEKLFTNPKTGERIETGLAICVR